MYSTWAPRVWKSYKSYKISQDVIFLVATQTPCLHWSCSFPLFNVLLHEIYFETQKGSTAWTCHIWFANDQRMTTPINTSQIKRHTFKSSSSLAAINAIEFTGWGSQEAVYAFLICIFKHVLNVLSPPLEFLGYLK